MANRLGRDEATITRWIRRYKDEGRSGLLSIKQAPGKEPAVSGENLERLKQKLCSEQGWKSYSQIQQWLKQELVSTLLIKLYTNS
ncbi:helix-turn-helix domain-containing protein [Plectonema cf. radiosum LEGE 06105]|uniref:Helix-turn-helix domain-containing protein n=1 Tax=Plectonema cf. radiosum LEGE 06105 TaxID=945769 RepID=A0A8J7FA78_9CYAN|nr:helix-turn-helix domain-containing protein [Plectonema cf. radiosum LEGE 06105]